MPKSLVLPIDTKGGALINGSLNRPSRKPLPPWPSSKPEDLESEDFNLVWEAIKTWDINVPAVYQGYCSATGNHVMEILFALNLRNIQDYQKDR